MNPSTTNPELANLPRRVNILGIDMSVVDLDKAVGQCDELIRSGGHGYVCCVDAHSMVESLGDPTYRRALNGAFLTVADGMPLVWLGRLRGCIGMDRVYGPDFLLAMCERSVERGWSHFFYGGGTDIASRLKMRLSERCPGLQVAGTDAPPYHTLTPEEESDLALRIEQTNPDVLWIGLGSPKQERFMAEHCGKLCCRLMVGVGAAFDFHSGAVKEAPRWLHRTGLQWAYRLMQEPRRLGRRYGSCVPAFLWNVGMEAAGIRNFVREAPECTEAEIALPVKEMPQ